MDTNPGSGWPLGHVAKPKSRLSGASFGGPARPPWGAIYPLSRETNREATSRHKVKTFHLVGFVKLGGGLSGEGRVFSPHRAAKRRGLIYLIEHFRK